MNINHFVCVVAVVPFAITHAFMRPKNGFAPRRQARIRPHLPHHQHSFQTTCLVCLLVVKYHGEDTTTLSRVCSTTCSSPSRNARLLHGFDMARETFFVGIHHAVIVVVIVASPIPQLPSSKGWHGTCHHYGRRKLTRRNAGCYGKRAK